MTTEELAELDRKIAVMQAYRDGKEVQSRNLCDENELWCNSEGKAWHWDWEQCDYRVKPSDPIRVKYIKDAVGNYCGGSRCFNGRVEREIEFVELTPEVRAKLGL